MEKKLAFDAVIGVLGVFVFGCLGGGVSVPWTVSWLPSNARILAAVGVLKGRRLSGGNRNGWRFFFATFAPPFCFDSWSGTSEDLRDDEMLSVGVFKDCEPDTESVVGLSNAAAAAAVSNGMRLDDLAEKNGWSTSLCGDSYALGIAGTGGTSSSNAYCVPSPRALGVDNLDDEAL